MTTLKMDKQTSLKYARKAGKAGRPLAAAYATHQEAIEVYAFEMGAGGHTLPTAFRRNREAVRAHNKAMRARFSRKTTRTKGNN